MSKENQHNRRIIRTLFMGVLLFCLAGQASAQTGFLEGLFGKKSEEGKETGSDSTKTEKERKPLESYFFDDSLRNRILFSWTVRPGFNQVDSLMIDTLLNRFEVDYPFMVPDAGSTYLGNLGGGALRLNYFERSDRRDFSFLDAFQDYLLTPENAPYFNVKRPFTNLSWYMSGQANRAEEQLRVTHAQNISPSTGINVHYLNRGTRGMYKWQRAKDKNLSVAFSHTGKRYSIHGGYTYNIGTLRENGGLQWDGDLAKEGELTLPNSLEVRLKDAQNVFKTNTFYVTQAYGIPLQRVTDFDLSIADKSSIFIGHAFEYTFGHRKYTDTYNNTLYNQNDPNGEGYDPYEKNAAYYDHWYVHPAQTLDSLYERRMDNKLFIQIQPWNRDGIIGTIDGGIGFSAHKYYISSLHEEYIHNRQQDVKKNDTYLYGGVHGKLRRYLDWNAGVDYHIVGFRSQDLRLDGEVKLSAYIKSRPITLTVGAVIDNRSPDYWMNSYFSNHFRWENDFAKELETKLEAKLEIPSIGLEAAVRQSVVTDKLYYGYGDDPDKPGSQIVQPLQNGGTISVTSAYLMKNFKIGILNLNHRVLVQKSSNDEVVPLPLVSANASYFLDFIVVRNVLQMQIGVNGFYNTEYYAPGYNPGLMRFHNQNMQKNSDGNYTVAKKTGNYPYLDAFATAKWKRMRILAKFQHVNDELFGTPTFFSTLHYPLNRRMFKLGFSWSFYD